MSTAKRRPGRPSTGQQKIYAFRAGADLIDAIDAAAKANDIGRSEITRRLLEFALQTIATRQERRVRQLKRAEEINAAIVADVLSEKEEVPPEPQATILPSRRGFAKPLSPEVIKAIADRAEKKN